MDKFMEELIEEMYDLGLQKVIDEANRQLQEYLLMGDSYLGVSYGYFTAPQTGRH